MIGASIAGIGHIPNPSILPNSFCPRDRVVVSFLKEPIRILKRFVND